MNDEQKKRIAELEKRIAEKQAAARAKTADELEEHNLGYLEALDKALDEHGDRLVTVDIAHVGKCLFRFPGRPDHAAFVRDVAKEITLGACVTYTTKCVLYPAPVAFKDKLDALNVEGFVQAANAIRSAMRPEDEEEGKG